MQDIKPYNSSANKKSQIKQMFDNIAHSYDFLNHTLSFGMDRYWRRKAIKRITNNPKKILDIATGTADFAITASKYTNAKIIGIDISRLMLNIAKKKIENNHLEKKIKLKLADSEDLPFDNSSFDAITIGFGVRNFENLQQGLKETYRVLKKNGIITILEPSIPKNKLIKQLYKLYFHYILPIIGGWISKDKKAYIYLPSSVNSFPQGVNFNTQLEEIGFKNINYTSLTFGVVSLYTAIK